MQGMVEEVKDIKVRKVPFMNEPKSLSVIIDGRLQVLLSDQLDDSEYNRLKEFELNKWKGVTYE